MNQQGGEQAKARLAVGSTRPWDFPHARILLFAKAPVAGQVKTRMVPALGAEGAARLHARLLRETAARVSATIAPVELWCAPDTGHTLFNQLAKMHGLALHRQLGSGLGERLRAASADALRRAQAVVLIGSDCPQLDAGYVARALILMQSQPLDAVLGPAADGGYVLLALRRAEPALFTQMPWGGDRVAAVTRERMAALDWRWRELPVLRDVDRPQDLSWYKSLHAE